MIRVKQTLKKSLSVLLVMMLLVSGIVMALPEDGVWMRAEAAGNTSLQALQNKFPHGYYWNHVGGSNNPDGYTSSPCTHHKNCGYYPNNCDCNSYSNAIQCHGFVIKLTYDYYGSSLRNWGTVSNLNSLKPGDAIRYKDDGHTIWVTGISGSVITYADCNSDGKCKIRWNQTIDKSGIWGLTKVYVAPYQLVNDTGSTPTPVDHTVDTSYPRMVTATAPARIDVCNADHTRATGHYIDPGDVCTIHEVYTDGCCKVEYPTSSGTAIYYCKVSDFGNQIPHEVPTPPEIMNPCDIGSDFFAYIEHQQSGYYLTNQLNNIAAEKPTGAAAQLWHFTRLGNGAYKIENVLNGSCMDVLSASLVGGTNIYAYDYYVGGSNQQFFVYDRYGAYYLSPVHAGDNYMIDVSPTTANLELWIRGNDWPAQEFNIRKTDFGGVNPCDIGTDFVAYIKHQESGNYLTNQLDNIAAETPTGNTKQLWRFTRLNNGAYKITSLYDGGCMDVLEYSVENGANIYAYKEYVAGMNQQFFIYDKYGAYHLSPINTAGNSMIDVSRETGNLELWVSGDDWSPQKFSIIKISSGGVNPCDVGTNFYAFIEHQKSKDYLTNQINNQNNIAAEVPTGAINQLWKFTRLDNGAYRVDSAYDGYCMDVLEYSVENGANIYAYKEYVAGMNQQFFIYDKYGAYHLSPINTAGNSMIDVSRETGNLELWVSGDDWSPQKFNILKTAFCVSYNANGGIGAPVSQVKNNGISLKLSQETPTRDGYVFMSWNTRKEGNGTAYAPGATYSSNESATLYAQWKAIADLTANDIATPTITSASTDTNKATINWNKVTGATSYRIYRADTKTGAKTLLKAVTTTTYTDTTAVTGKTYYYFVAAYNSAAGILGNYSAAKSVTVKAAATIAVPTISSAVTDTNKVTLGWNSITGATSYRVFRADTKTGAKTLLKVVNPTTYTDTTAVTGKTYYYFVKAYNSTTGVLSDYSAAKEVTVKAAPVVTTIDAPVISSVSTNTNKVTINWDKVTGATGYRVYRITDGTRKELARVTATTYVDTTVTTGKMYHYEVKAYNGTAGILSDYSAKRAVKVIAAPVITSANVSPKITWSKVADATSYRVFRTDVATGKRILLKAVGVSTTSYTDDTAESGKTYIYYVRAYSGNASTLSDYSTGRTIKAK